MDTKTPPIALKLSEKSQRRKEERTVDVTLPPLATYTNHRAKTKEKAANLWTRGVTCPPQHHDQRKKRPYRVLHIGATPLMHACQQADRSRLLRLLKEQEDTIHYRDRTLRSALHYCMDAGSAGAVAAAAPELVNAADAEGHTPLHLAVIAGDTQLVAVLLAHGADVNAKDLEGHSVLHWATVCGEAECVRLVLAAGARPSTSDLRGGSPLHYAAQCCGAAVTAELAVPKKVALKVLHTLLEFGADVNAKDEDGRQPILWAASAGSVEAVLALARAGGSASAAASDKDGLTALHCAASRGHVKCIEALVNLCGSQPDHVDDNGCSALHYAATLGHADATALILKLGADPNRQDRKGRTPLLCAAAKGQLETLKILAQHGGSLHARMVRGTGVAHEAVASGRIELIEWLAKKRPSTLDVVTQDGKTPLHVAALHGHLDACKLLLDHGARVNAILRSSKGTPMTALDAALYRGHRDCAKLIQMHGGATAERLSRLRDETSNGVSFATRSRASRRAASSTECMESTDERDNSPITCERGYAKPRLYYEEHWIETKTQRRGSLKKVGRQDSRSFSEEEIRLSKNSSSKKARQRRTRSESARYDEDNSLRRRVRRRRTSRKRRRHRYNYSDSSIDSYSDEKFPASAFIRRGLDRYKFTSKMSKENGCETEESVSEDSLEVVVVKRSFEKKDCDESKGRTGEKASHKQRQKQRQKEEQEQAQEQEQEQKQEQEQQQESKEPERTFIEESVKEETSQSQVENRYHRDMTDSTSQETVERVVVTAIVHNDQGPDTPKSTTDVSKEVTFADTSEKIEEIESSDIVVRTDESEKTVEEKKKNGEEITEEESNDQGRSDVHQVTESTSVSLLSPRDEKHSATKGETSLEVTETTSDLEPPSVAPKKNENENSAMITFEENEKKVENGSCVLEHDKREQQKHSKEFEHEEELIRPSFIKEKECIETVESVSEPTLLSIDEKVHDEKEQVDSARGKSIDLSSDSRNSTLMGEADDRSSRIDTPISARRLASHEKTTSSSSSAFEKVDTEVTKRSVATETFTSGNKDARGVKTTTTILKATDNIKSLERRRPSTAKTKRKKNLLGSSEERCSNSNRAIIAVIERPKWTDDAAATDVDDEEEDAEVEREIREAIGEDVEQDTEIEEDNEIGVVRVLPSTSEEETCRRGVAVSGTSAVTSLPRVQTRSCSHSTRIPSPTESRRIRLRTKQRRDSAGRDSGIEPSPRVSRIPRRRNAKCCPNTEKHRALNMETITRDVQISLRRYHLERKIFFQLMELKRLQIRHGRANEHVLVKRQVESFHKAGMSGPALGVAKYDQPLTFRHFEAFLYEQLRKLQRRTSTPNFCTEAKQCTEKTHRCHHATSAYTSVPVYTYLGGDVRERTDLLPKIETRGRGHMTVEVTHGEEKQVIALPAEKLDRAKKYFVTFTVRGEGQVSERPKSLHSAQRNAKSV